MSSKIYFKGLNELRAIAAFAVVFHHLELYNNRDGIISLFDIPFFNTFINNLGKNGVYLFFALSGFLITTLLIKEKEFTKTIGLKKFYMRRVLRIWPLYFIIVLLGYFIIPLSKDLAFFSGETYFINSQHDTLRYALNNFSLYLTFLSNFAQPIPGAAQTWSVSVEEQFYILWPIIIRFSSAKNLRFILVAIIIGFVFATKFSSGVLLKIALSAPLHLMAIGSITAYYFNKKNSYLEKISSNNNYYLMLLCAIIVLLFFSQATLITVLFSILLVFIVQDRKTNLRNKLLNQLGTISYGIYMYHIVCIYVSSAIAKNITHSTLSYKIVYYILSITLTIFVSKVSYELIEKKLIRIKNTKYTSLN